MAVTEVRGLSQPDRTARLMRGTPAMKTVWKACDRAR